MTPEEFFAVLRDMPAPMPLPCRLYHDDQGRVLFYSMEDCPGKWIEVDSETYARARQDIRVLDGRIVPVPRTPQIMKLRPSQQGTCCDPRDICLVVASNQPHQKWSMNASE